jgi:hypothetical protein
MNNFYCEEMKLYSIRVAQEMKISNLSSYGDRHTNKLSISQYVLEYSTSKCKYTTVVATVVLK